MQRVCHMELVDGGLGFRFEEVLLVCSFDCVCLGVAAGGERVFIGF